VVEQGNDLLVNVDALTHRGLRKDRRAELRAAGMMFAPLICLEIAFPDTSRHAGQDGAQLLPYRSPERGSQPGTVSTSMPAASG
jgi:hypothetical protein